MTPFDDGIVESLHAGDEVLLSGIVYTARDAAHKRMAAMIARGERLPFDPRGAVLYYVGPTPAKPGNACGSAGPTTSGRMDSLTPMLLERGLKGMIGKGVRSPAVIESMKANKAVYFAAIGGLGALLSKRIKSVRVVAFEDLGPESLKIMELEDFPVTVAVDCYGGDLYAEGVAAYVRSR